MIPWISSSSELRVFLIINHFPAKKNRERNLRRALRASGVEILPQVLMSWMGSCSAARGAQPMTRLRGTDGFDAWRSIIKAPPFSFRQSLPIFFHEEKLPFLPLKVQKGQLGLLPIYLHAVRGCGCHYPQSSEFGQQPTKQLRGVPAKASR